MLDPLIAHLAEQTGVPEATVEKVLRGYRNALATAVAPGGEARFPLFDLAMVRVTTEPVGPMHQPSVGGKSRSVTASILGVYARMLHISPTLTMRAALEPILVSETAYVGLFDEPWSRWKHGYGSADDVPHELWLAAALDVEKRDDARRKLRSNLVRGGAVYHASAHAVPYLVRLARSEELAERADLLEIVHLIAKAPKPEDSPGWWDQHVALLRKERSAIEALTGDGALTGVARAILETSHFVR
ncbi:hypothetical protein BH09MYX1_BH09MYX1_24070 [soil metagenome]